LAHRSGREESGLLEGEARARPPLLAELPVVDLEVAEPPIEELIGQLSRREPGP
jgi:hypothetical protein